MTTGPGFATERVLPGGMFTRFFLGEFIPGAFILRTISTMWAKAQIAWKKVTMTTLP